MSMKRVLQSICTFLLVGSMVFEPMAVLAEEDADTELHASFMQRVQDVEERIMEEEGVVYQDDEPMESEQCVTTFSGPTIAEVLGMSGEKYMDWLKCHQYDDYYLGTPYIPDDYRSPHGDPFFNGREGMNCTGFVWHALRVPTYASGGNTEAIPGISGWVNFYKRNGIQRQYFATKEEMLASGYLEKGDLIWIFDGDENQLSSTHHIGIYWGDGQSDTWWHSLDGWSRGLGMPCDGNMISNIGSAGSSPFYVALKTGGIETPPSADKFQDNFPTAWYYDYVNDVFDRKIMTGLNEYYFGVSESLARAQFATVLYRMENQPEAAYNAPFPDVSDGTYYSVPVSWAKENGVIGGYENGLFGPADSITREQMVVMMHRYAKTKGDDISQRGDLSVFPDGESVTEFAQEAMSWAVAEQIIKGKGNGYLEPQGNVNRAECATIISRYCASIQ